MSAAAIQRLDALGRANRIRGYRAKVKNELRRGLLAVSVELLEDPDLAGMPVGDLLRSVPKWGHVRTRRTLERLRISPYRKLRELTERQRSMIAGATPR